MLKETVLQAYRKWLEATARGLRVRGMLALQETIVSCGVPKTTVSACQHVSNLKSLLTAGKKLRQKAENFERMFECIVSRESIDLDYVAEQLCDANVDEVDQLLELV